MKYLRGTSQYDDFSINLPLTKGTEKKETSEVELGTGVKKYIVKFRKYDEEELI